MCRTMAGGGRLRVSRGSEGAAEARSKPGASQEQARNKPGTSQEQARNTWGVTMWLRRGSYDVPAMLRRSGDLAGTSLAVLGASALPSLPTPISDPQLPAISDRPSSINLSAPSLDLPAPFPDNPKCRMPAKSSARKKQLARQSSRALDIQIQFMEGLVRRDPAFVEALQLLGDHYTARGRFPESLKVDERLAQLYPRNPLVFYNLACSYSLNGQFDRAVAVLEQALSFGYRDFDWLTRDPDLRELRKHPAFRSLKDKIRRLQVKSRSR